MIDHLQKSIYENTEIANLRDENFANNASGVAMQYKLLSMQNKADSKERKFTKALKQMYKIVFQTLFDNDSQREQWSTLKFHFTRNLPDDISSMISAAKMLKEWYPNKLNYLYYHLLKIRKLKLSKSTKKNKKISRMHNKQLDHCLII